MTITALTPKALRKAANIKEKIDALQDKISELLGNGASTPAANTGKPRKKHRMSRAGRAAIAAAARARWAKYGNAVSAKPGRKPKRKMSAAARAKMAAVARARWKAAKAAGKTTL